MDIEEPGGLQSKPLPKSQTQLGHYTTTNASLYQILAIPISK